MSKMLNINGAHYLPATEAGRNFGYTNDYVAKLAREKKILGTRVGRQWFVDPESLKSFIKEAKQRKQEHAKRLRVERKQERLILEEISYGAGDRTQNVTTLLKAGAVVGVGTLLGALFFISSQGQIQFQNISLSTLVTSLEQVAYDLYNVGAGGKTVEQNKLPASAVSSAREEVRQEELKPGSKLRDVKSGDASEGVVVLKDEGKNTTSEFLELERSFSDEVIITRDADGKTGTIRPIFKNKKDETYRFLLVPIKDSDK